MFWGLYPEALLLEWVVEACSLITAPVLTVLVLVELTLHLSD
jgi:hypothetical protein